MWFIGLDMASEKCCKYNNTLGSKAQKEAKSTTKLHVALYWLFVRELNSALAVAKPFSV